MNEKHFSIAKGQEKTEKLVKERKKAVRVGSKPTIDSIRMSSHSSLEMELNEMFAANTPMTNFDVKANERQLKAKKNKTRNVVGKLTFDESNNEF